MLCGGIGKKYFFAIFPHYISGLRLKESTRKGTHMEWQLKAAWGASINHLHNILILFFVIAHCQSVYVIKGI